MEPSIFEGFVLSAHIGADYEVVRATEMRFCHAKKIQQPAGFHSVGLGPSIDHMNVHSFGFVLACRLNSAVYINNHPVPLQLGTDLNIHHIQFDLVGLLSATDPTNIIKGFRCMRRRFEANQTASLVL